MCTTFYFNELLPPQTELDVVGVFEHAVIKTGLLIKKLGMVMPIVTSGTSEKVTICGMSLQSIINTSSNRNVQVLGWQLFTHNNTISMYEDALDADDCETVLKGGYLFENQDATNLALAQIMDWPLLSLPLSEALRKDTITLTSETLDDIIVVNYYGQDDTTFIEQWVNEKALASLDGLAKLTALLGSERIIVADGFEKEWNAATTQNQMVAYKRFELCCGRNMLFPVRADDVTVQKDEVNGAPDVYELRQKGSGVRVYFGYSDDGGKMVLAVLSNKSGAKGVEQNAEILRAQARIRRALALAK